MSKLFRDPFWVRAIRALKPLALYGTASLSILASFVLLPPMYAAFLCRVCASLLIALVIRNRPMQVRDVDSRGGQHEAEAECH